MPDMGFALQPESATTKYDANYIIIKGIVIAYIYETQFQKL